MVLIAIVMVMDMTQMMTRTIDQDYDSDYNNYHDHGYDPETHHEDYFAYPKSKSKGNPNGDFKNSRYKNNW